MAGSGHGSARLSESLSPAIEVFPNMNVAFYARVSDADVIEDSSRSLNSPYYA